MSATRSPEALRIVIVSQYFRPERVSIPVTLADELSRRGHHVEVVTGWPNYPEGKLFPNYRQRLRHKELQGDVTVHRVPLIVSHSTSAVGRLLNYASFALTSAAKFSVGRRADVVYVYATQMTASVGPSLWRRLFGTPYVLHVQDLWPESIVGSGMVDGRASKTIGAALTPWLSSTYRRAAHVIAIAPTMLGMLRSRGAAAEASSAVLNWSPRDVVDDSAVFAEDPARTGTEMTTFVYAGNLGELQDLPVLIDAFASCSDLADIKLLIAGAGVLEPELREQAARYSGARIEFLGRIDASGMQVLNARSDYQFVTLKGLDVFRGTIPSKLQNSLSAGVPVITTVHGDVSDLVERERVGFTARPSDPTALADAIRRAAATTRAERVAMADRARRFYEENMSESAGVSAVEAILRDASMRATAPAKTRATENEIER